MTAPLDAVNEAFHSAYDARREEAKNDEPILVVLADELVLFIGNTKTKVTYTPPEFTVVKSVAHAPVALWLRGPSPKLRAFVRKSIGEANVSLHPLLEKTLRAIDDPALDRDAFAHAVGPLLKDAIAYATKLQLDAMHARTEEVVAKLTPAQRKQLHVAVTGDHQARVRSFPMQYFVKRLGADRVLYAEGVEDPEEAAALVGAQRLDRAMATAFFGNAKRMERDLLGDAAEKILAATDLEPI